MNVVIALIVAQQISIIELWKKHNHKVMRIKHNAVKFFLLNIEFETQIGI